MKLHLAFLAAATSIGLCGYASADVTILAPPSAPVPGAPGTGLAGSLTADNADTATWTAANLSYICNTVGLPNTIGAFIGNLDGNEDYTPSPGANSDLGSLAPASVAGDDGVNFSATISGYIAIPAPGAYNFTQYSDDGSTLTIAGQLVDSTTWHSPQTTTAHFAQAGLYPVSIAFSQGGGGAYYKLSLDGGADAIPTAQLFTQLPEPATVGLAGFAGLLMLRRRKA